ncbi:MAG TPA: substrate-binding domain-containing protein, partial [Acidimicrobiales bacterium]|nr:substrate-binding domain-containing protein [Acidimicrobiales bacterium]
LQRAPHPDAARAFVAYLTGSHARSILRRYGFPPVHPVQVSQPRGVPADLRRALGLPTAR